MTDWERFESTWAQYRDQLTHALSTVDFAATDSAFACMRTLARACKRDIAKPPPNPGEPPHFDPSDEILGNYFEVVQRAKQIVLNASFRWWEREARRKTVGR